MQIDAPAIPIAALFNADNTGPNPDHDLTEAIAAAEIIISTDVMTGHQSLLYGTDVLQEVRRGNDSRLVRTMNIALDPDTPDWPIWVQLSPTARRCLKHNEIQHAIKVACSEAEKQREWQ